MTSVTGTRLGRGGELRPRHHERVPRSTARAGSVLGAVLLVAGIAAACAAAPPAPPASQAPAPPTTSTQMISNNCASSPHGCGFPDATNTGVPAGTTLRRVPGDVTSGPGWSWRNGAVFATSGAVLDGLDIAGMVDVNGTNVTVRNSRITTRSFANLLVRDSSANVTITDTEIIGSGSGCGAGIQVQDSVPVTVTRVNVHHCATGIQQDRGTISDSYLWDLVVAGDLGTHVNGITSNAGSGSAGLTIRHNTIFNPLDQTDAVSLFQDFGVQQDVTITNNLLAGGGYTIYGGEGGKGATRNIRITNNRIATIYFPAGGYWGWLAHFTAGDPGNLASGNVWDSTGAPVD